jgi:hypothetical protein
MDLCHGDFGGLEEPVVTLSVFHNDWSTPEPSDLPSALQYAQTRARKSTQKLQRYGLVLFCSCLSSRSSQRFSLVLFSLPICSIIFFSLFRRDSRRYESYIHQGVRQALGDLHNARERLNKSRESATAAHVCLSASRKSASFIDVLAIFFV